jgi:ATP-dependent exoDNAse (exonuclease V) alpha subunit
MQRRSSCSSGGDRQLPEIEAGGAFRALADRLGASELREVRRQREAWDRDALRALRDGDTERFAREYREHAESSSPQPPTTSATRSSRTGGVPSSAASRR